MCVCGIERYETFRERTSSLGLRLNKSGIQRFLGDSFQRGVVRRLSSVRTRWVALVKTRELLNQNPVSFKCRFPVPFPTRPSGRE